MDRTKSGKILLPSQALNYKHFTYLQRPILPPVFVSVATYSRLVRSPTPQSRYDDSIIERSSINTYISMFSSIETPITTTTTTNETISDEDFNSLNSEGFPLDRFLGEIDDFFKCPFCKKIVSKPQECIYCQNLMCKNCVSNVFKCPYGCENLQVNQPSKFALLSYMKLKIKCYFTPAGCDYIGRIKDISDHEKDCDFSEVKCINPVCDIMFIKKTKAQNGPVICSEICNCVLNFKNFMDNNTNEEYLEEFVRIIEEARGNIQNELKNELNELMAQAQEKKNEVEEFLRSKEELYEDIEEWRTMHHSGKWNHVVKWWTCCENREKFSKGCTLIN
ncbi:hypothetical protein SteCoe_5111 [Stentor coeruleus]|uniref:E3 ubiquitin-protein ligase n=1 Tax=Stentor coeruleus TaxID=5963 RepID=A0A1R2CT30_9CILI|nr:hypothetical protein SteCoe_5111 [Stentor coeruleus]